MTLFLSPSAPPPPRARRLSSTGPCRKPSAERGDHRGLRRRSSPARASRAEGPRASRCASLETHRARFCPLQVRLRRASRRRLSSSAVFLHFSEHERGDVFHVYAPVFRLL